MAGARLRPASGSRVRASGAARGERPANGRRSGAVAPDAARGTAASAARHELGGEQVEGRRAVLELLAAGRRQVREVWIAEGLDPAPQLDEIERWCARRHVRVAAVSRRQLQAAARTDAPQGVLAYAEPLEPVDLDDLCRAGPDGPPLLLVLDGVTDPHNVGAMLRSAACAGVTGVVLPRHRAVHVTAAVAKVAAGAVEHLDVAVVAGVPAALSHLAGHGVVPVGLDAGAGTSLYELGDELRGPVALVLGSEGRGLGQLTRRRCAVLASIPQPGPLPSLNVATAAAIASFEVVRRRLAPT